VNGLVLRLFNKSMLFDHFSLNSNNMAHFLLVNSFKILAGEGVPMGVPSFVGISISVKVKVGDASSVETACSAFNLMLVNEDQVGRSTL